MSSNEGSPSKKKLWGLITFESPALENNEADSLSRMEDMFNLTLEQTKYQLFLETVKTPQAKQKAEKHIQKLEQKISLLKIEEKSK